VAYFVFKSNGRRSYLYLRRVRYKGVWRWRWRDVEEKYIRSSFLVICGGRGSGKTREMKKLTMRSSEVFGVSGVYIKCAEGIDNWFKRAGIEQDELKGLKQFEKVELLIDRLRGRAVFLDGVDRVSGKVKVETVKRIIGVARAGAVSCESEKRVDVGILQAIRRKQGLRKWESLRVVELGAREEEIKDIGGIIAVFLVLGFGLFFGISEAVLGAMGLRYLVREGNRIG
jgi:hypothetical protein